MLLRPLGLVIHSFFTKPIIPLIDRFFLDFGEFVTLIRNDLLGIGQNIPVKKISSKALVESNELERLGVDPADFS